MVIIANKWKQLLVQRQFLLAPVPIKNSILSIAKSPNLQKTLDFPAGSQHSRRSDEWLMISLSATISRPDAIFGTDSAHSSVFFCAELVDGGLGFCCALLDLEVKRTPNTATIRP